MITHMKSNSLITLSGHLRPTTADSERIFSACGDIVEMFRGYFREWAELSVSH